MEDKEVNETPQTRFEKQLGHDELALTRAEIMAMRGYPVKKKEKKNGK